MPGTGCDAAVLIDVPHFHRLVLHSFTLSSATGKKHGLVLPYKTNNGCHKKLSTSTTNRATKSRRGWCFHVFSAGLGFRKTGETSNGTPSLLRATHHQPSPTDSNACHGSIVAKQNCAVLSRFGQIPQSCHSFPSRTGKDQDF